MVGIVMWGHSSNRRFTCHGEGGGFLVRSKAFVAVCVVLSSYIIFSQPSMYVISDFKPQSGRGDHHFISTQAVYTLDTLALLSIYRFFPVERFFFVLGGRTPPPNNTELSLAPRLNIRSGLLFLLVDEPSQALNGRHVCALT